MSALEYQPPDTELDARIRQGIDRHLDIHGGVPPAPAP